MSTMLVITIAFGIVNWTFAFCFVATAWYARGTRQRYVLASIAWTLAPFVMLQPIWMVISGRPMWWWMIVTFANYFCVYLLYQDDDDNYWKRKKKKLKKWIENLSRKPALAGRM